MNSSKVVKCGMRKKENKRKDEDKDKK